jgi:predicted peroxiredoxin
LYIRNSGVGAENIKIGGVPPLKEVMDQATKAAEILVICEQNCGLLGIPRGDFALEARIVGATTLNELALRSDTPLCCERTTHVRI